MLPCDVESLELKPEHSPKTEKTIGSDVHAVEIRVRDETRETRERLQRTEKVSSAKRLS